MQNETEFEELQFLAFTDDQIQDQIKMYNERLYKLKQEIFRRKDLDDQTK
jgi:hypothetical protein